MPKHNSYVNTPNPHISLFLSYASPSNIYGDAYIKVPHYVYLSSSGEYTQNEKSAILTYPKLKRILSGLMSLCITS